MQQVLVDAVVGFVLSPWLTNLAINAMVRHADIRNPKVWIAVAAGVYGTLSVILGMAFGAGAGGGFASALGLSSDLSWLASLLGGAVALTLNFWRVLVIYDRVHGSLPDSNQLNRW